LSEARSRAVSVWLDARPRDDLAAYLDGLRPVVELSRRYAEAVRGDADELYDALLDDYEPGARAAELEPLLAELAAGVRPLVEPATAASPPPLPAATWPSDAQVELAHEVAELIGFDLEHGAIARSAHPFTTSIGAGDVRFTTRVDEAEPVSNIRAVLHEAGHALYEQGFPARLAGTFAHDAPSLGAHESQSLFWENHVGRTDGFWQALEPALVRLFPQAMGSVGIERVTRTSRRVQPSLIRVEADEVTYNLHIVLRFRLELALVRGDLPLQDLPAAFDDGMEELLGLRPPQAADGVMQDIHWPQGLIGYFPTYSLGHLYAAQLAETAAREVGPISDLAGEGSFSPILAFLRRTVHERARLVRTDELMRDANGDGLSTEPFVRHLRSQYLPA
ncbi:MAG: carboxypeptidase M32, partial [Miltoncostaeaceae bacterium]